MTDEQPQTRRRTFPVLAAVILIVLLAAALTYQTSTLMDLEDSLDIARTELESARKEIAELKHLNRNQEKLLIDFAEQTHEPTETPVQAYPNPGGDAPAASPGSDS